MLPTVAFAAGAENDKAIQLVDSGTAANISGGQNDNIYFGTWDEEPIKWRVLDNRTNTGESGLFLLSDTLLGTGRYGDVYFDNSGNTSNAWQSSTAKTWCNNFYGSSFSNGEQGAVLATTKSDEAFTRGTGGISFAASENILNGDKVFFLSAEEAENSAYGFTDDNARIANYGNSAGVWWLRSPYAIFTNYAGVVFGDGPVYLYVVSGVWAARPAFNLNLNSVLFASAAVGGKPDGGLIPISEYTGNEWKLTLKDRNRNFAVTETTVSGDPGDTVTLHYTGATAGINEYISVILADNSGAKYYGRVAQPTEATGTVEIKIPSDIAPGSYTLKVFSEQCNGDKKTDYASDFTDIALTVEKQADEQFTLAPGGTYYFDLSDENIPGTANDSLPDSTLHYVPFTYAGAVDAYSLKNEVDTDTTSYKHSLFVADYAVTHTVSWDNLNTADLIFGKDYAAGGVGYTLRAPSAGNHVEGPSSNRYIAPINNEWDTILQKSSGYIDNWRGVYSVCQDLYVSGSSVVYRGYNSTRQWMFMNRNYNPNGTHGFRPVLEVLNPDTLGADGLKVVTLDLGGGTLGGSAEDIQIIVKNGESFTAPASDGLTRPDGNTENYFKWLGSDGNLYAPGESVSADVTKLTAKFAGGSSGSGGGGGSRKPSVTYYTLHFETNGGSAITDMREENNTRISLTKYVPTRHGYTFIGWYSDHNLTNQVSEVSLTKNMTVYAGWRADENPDIVVNPFTDVSEKDWFYNDAMFVYKNGLMLGTSKTLFSPHGTVTRGMMATILWRMEGSLAPKGENSFTDVEAGMWYTDAITWTAENGIFAGYSKEKFGPDDPITREQLTAIFYRYADYKGYKLTVTGNLDKFEDADKITDYAKTVMQWAVGNGLIKGKSETLLDPQGTATRAEIAAMLHRFVEKAKPMQMD